MCERAHGCVEAGPRAVTRTKVKTAGGALAQAGHFSSIAWPCCLAVPPAHRQCVPHHPAIARSAVCLQPVSPTPRASPLRRLAIHFSPIAPPDFFPTMRRPASCGATNPRAASAFNIKDEEGAGGKPVFLALLS